MSPYAGLSIDIRDSKREESEADDPGLILSARSGDDDAFAALYRRYREPIYAICLGRLRDAALAEDVVQDTFMRAYACLDRFDVSRRMLPWLVSIAVRRCTDLFRRNGRTEATDDLASLMLNGFDGADPTLDAVVAGEDRRRLERALRRLAPRQRRALLLYALEGWSYADIAAAEGISVGSTKSLLFHARETLRRACRRGLLATVFLPAGALRNRFRRSAESFRARVQTALEPFVGVGGNALTSGITALVLAATTAGASAQVATSPALGRVGHRAGVATDGSGVGDTTVRGTTLVARGPRAVPLTAPLFDPAAGTTPEETQFQSFAPSPNYKKDHTIFAAGAAPCAHSSCPVLFRSSDGGATWTRLRAQGFRGYRLLLPPAYPRDPTIFAMGPPGLQRSDDGGATFETVHPIEGEAAMSPLFNNGDPRILIAAGTVFEYWANSGVLTPASLIAPAGLRLTVAFSPSFPSDDRFFVGGLGVDTGGVQRPSIHRCVGVVCEQALLPSGSGVPELRVSPRFSADRTTYVFTADTLFRSRDGGATFATIAKPGPAQEKLRDLVLQRGMLLAGVQGAYRSRGGVYRSSDGGRTWVGGGINMPGFEGGVAVLAAFGGRLWAAGVDRGLACSMNSGRTWTAACGR